LEDYRVREGNSFAFTFDNTSAIEGQTYDNYTLKITGINQFATSGVDFIPINYLINNFNPQETIFVAALSDKKTEGDEYFTIRVEYEYRLYREALNDWVWVGGGNSYTVWIEDVDSAAQGYTRPSGKIPKDFKWITLSDDTYKSPAFFKDHETQTYGTGSNGGGEFNHAPTKPQGIVNSLVALYEGSAKIVKELFGDSPPSKSTQQNIYNYHLRQAEIAGEAYTGAATDKPVDPEATDQKIRENRDDFVEKERHRNPALDMTIDIVEGGSKHRAAAGDSFYLSVHMSDGDETVRSGSRSADVFIGSENRDRSNLRNGDDFVHAGSGDDYILGGSGNDYLIGGDGDDWLEGGSGDDILYGGGDLDVMVGGDGKDRFVMDAFGTFIDAISDFTPQSIDPLNADRLDLSAFSAIRDFEDLLPYMIQDSGEVYIGLAGGSIALWFVNINELSREDFIFA